VGRRDGRHGGRARSGAFLRWAPVVLVLALLAGAGAAYRFDLGARWFGTGEPDPASEPAAVAPPEGLSLPELTLPDLVAQPEAAPQASTALVRRALAPLVGDGDLGPHVLVAAGDLTGTDLVTLGDGPGDGPAIPASTMKLLTTTAALEALGPDHEFATTVVGRGRRVVLVGGGDPFLASSPQPGAWPARADVVTLARQTAAALREQGRRAVTVGYDDSLFSGPAVNPAWPATYVPEGVVAPITSLWVDAGADPDGYGKATDPSSTAAAAFADALAKRGIRVAGAPAAVRAPGGAPELARVTSAPVSQIVEKTIAVSDNEAAEVLAHHVGLAVSGTGSARAGAAGVRETLTGLGVRLGQDVIRDGSGLSREDRLTATTLIDVLRVAASPDHPELRAVLTGLPVAGFSGSLEFRFEQEALPARGLVRAKTGTLSGVSALAGVATDREGAPIAFVLVADEIDLADTLDARAALDDLAAALAACHCSA